MTVRKKLNDRQRAACQHYLTHWNWRLACEQAGYKSTVSHSWEVFNSPAVREYLKELMAKQAKKAELSAQRVLTELTRLAFHDPSDYYYRDSKGKLVLKDIDQLTPDQTAAIAEYDPEKKTLKLYSKDPSLDKLGKHFKLFTELHEQQHTFTIMPELKLGGSTIVFNVGEPVRKK